MQNAEHSDDGKECNDWKMRRSQNLYRAFAQGCGERSEVTYRAGAAAVVVSWAAPRVAVGQGKFSLPVEYSVENSMFS